MTSPCASCSGMRVTTIGWAPMVMMSSSMGWFRRITSRIRLLGMRVSTSWPSASWALATPSMAKYLSLIQAIRPLRSTVIAPSHKLSSWANREAIACLWMACESCRKACVMCVNIVHRPFGDQLVGYLQMMQVYSGSGRFNHVLGLRPNGRSFRPGFAGRHAPRPRFRRYAAPHCVRPALFPAWRAESCWSCSASHPRSSGRSTP